MPTISRVQSPETVGALTPTTEIVIIDIVCEVCEFLWENVSVTPTVLQGWSSNYLVYRDGSNDIIWIQAITNNAQCPSCSATIPLHIAFYVGNQAKITDDGTSISEGWWRE
jgi:hypothetical protein